MPNEAFFDYPIVVLEADSPQAIGKVGLYDYLVSVGSTGIRFVAAMAGMLQPWGPVFQPAAIMLANLRAGSTLAQMGLISGDTFAFLRFSIQLQQSDVAAFLGVPLLTEQNWENNSVPLPRLIWCQLAERVCAADQRYLPPELQGASTPPSFRPRLIRIFPNSPQPHQPFMPQICPPCTGPPDCPPVIG